MSRNLTDRQIAFCKERAKGLSGTRSAINAGYSKKNAHVQASNLMKKAKIIERINDERISLLTDENGITPKFLIAKLLILMDSPKETVQIKSLELLGKYLGMWKADQEQAGPNAPAEVDPATAELLEKMKRDREEEKRKAGDLPKGNGIPGARVFDNPTEQEEDKEDEGPPSIH